MHSVDWCFKLNLAPTFVSTIGGNTYLLLTCYPIETTPDYIPLELQQTSLSPRNEIERLFRRLINIRRIFSRFDKLDVMFTGFLLFTLIVEALR